MADIKLPPLPKLLPRADGWTYLNAYTEVQLRARDIEVARCVLEAAAKAAGPDDSYQDEWFRAKTDAVNRICALEVKHD